MRARLLLATGGPRSSTPDTPTVAAAARATYLLLSGGIGVKDKMKTLRGRRHRRRERAIMMSARHRAAAAATAGRPKVKRNA